MAAAVVILTTTATRTEADRIAATLVEERLAACVQIAAIASIYRWEGRIKSADEQLLLVKTTENAASACEARIAALHSYEVPEILRLATATASPSYLAWLAGEVASR